MTAPFGPVLESALKENVQGGKLCMYKGVQVHPQFYCCISGTNVGVAKDPVAMLHLSTTRVCMNTAVTADYSLSWSPSSTITAWEVDWGDGNVSNGVWPGAGSVAHPGGGYALPITYTVTLTVTDLLGATGIAQVQIEVIDCTLAEIELFAGCGASGTWRSEVGGISWDDVSRGTLAGVTVHDMKVNWFTIGTESVEMWAATENGVYTSIAGSTWTRKALPLPGVYLVEPLPVAITCSKYDPLEVYVLATSAAGVSWLYRTVDAGETWAYRAVGPLGIGEPVGGGLNSDVNAMYWDASNNYMYVGGWCWFPTGTYAFNRAGYWHSGAWDPVGQGVDDIVEAIAEDNSGGIWYGGAFTNVSGFASNKVAMWDGAVWHDRSLAGWGNNARGLAMYGPDMYVTGENNAETVSYWSGGVWNIAGASNGNGYALHATANFLYCGGSFTTMAGDTVNYIARWNGVTWDALDSGISGTSVSAIKSNADGTEIYVGGNFTAASAVTAYYFAMWNEITNEWTSPCIGLERLNGSVYAIAVSDAGDVYIGGAFTATTGGTTLNRIARWSRATDAWVPVGSGFNASVYSLEFDEYGNLWAGGAFTQDGDGNAVAYISMVGPGAGTPATVGRTSLIDMSADGQYIYVALLDGGANPAILRVDYELASMVNLYVPGAGTWGGVVADHFFSNVMWMFGDFGAEKVLVSDDWGETNDDRTDAGWNGAEVVRPLLPSDWNSNDVVAMLNFANESWRSKNWGEDWAKQGDTAFDCDCGARDPFEPDNVWIGRDDAGALHIQYSPNSGVNWEERSTNFTANAPVTALQVTK